jgi:rubrerythrin
MSETKTMEILKQAILLETRGKSFYQMVAEQTEAGAVRSFFEFMAEEEQKHMDVLARQYKAYKEKGSLDSASYDKGETSRLATEVLDGEIKSKISAAGFEAAAIGAAISMEERAVRIYAERADSSTDPEEKALYQWLSDWERQHLALLADIDKSLVEKIWFDNSFWPF